MTNQSVLPESPPSVTTDVVAWVKKNLFDGWFNSLLTVGIGFALIKFLLSFGEWVTTKARWDVIPANLPLFMVGRFPASQYWRAWLIAALLVSVGGLTWGMLTLSKEVEGNHQIGFSRNTLIGIGILAFAIVLLPLPTPNKAMILGILSLALGGCFLGRLGVRKIPIIGGVVAGAWVVTLILVLWLLAGGFGLETVGTDLWNGLLLTIFMALISIGLSFPLGMIFALGRQSSLPIVKFFSVTYIEFFRGLPLVGILFAAQVMLPLILPGDWRIDRVVRAIAGLTIFTSAYLAEAIRGGLQSIPKGQIEAASALGLNTPLSLYLIVMPQALRAVIPAMMNLFLSLFKDTSLLAVVGLVELTGISRNILANPNFLGRFAEVYLFVATIYLICCSAMSQASKQLEANLGVGKR
jgi:general L-amino acid transport system permease protein